MSGDATDPVIDDLTAALSAWHGAIACADAAFSHGANEDFEWGEAVGALNAARRLASCADAARAHGAEAEKGGAVKALRYVAAKLLEHGPASERSPLVRGVTVIHAETIAELADIIESGEVTL